MDIEQQQGEYTMIANNDGTYNIIEIPSKQVIFRQMCFDSAEKLISKFNKSNVGFSGWTPTFCLPESLTRFNIKKVIKHYK
jgi:hypothetical protein